MEKTNKRKKVFFLLAGILTAAVLSGGFLFLRAKKEKAAQESAKMRESATEVSTADMLDSISFAGALVTGENVPKPPPPPVDMARLKSRGCVADGLLTEYNPDQEKYIRLVNRSKCYYLHRAIETWREPPDFEKIEKNMGRIEKPEVVYGMFLAEAIGTKDGYKNEDTGHIFDFDEMCHDESINDWGEHTCKPTFSSDEYQDYLKYITRRAIDLGVQSFTFGQIYMQESDKRNYAPEIVRDIRKYAEKKGVDIIIGAQTGSITDPKYVKLFDYIEGGVGIDGNGSVESGPCLSTRGSCWALLWHEKFSGNAKNVLLHLDWTGIPSDDLDIFARMDAEKRVETLQNLHGYFTSRKMGFLMPYFGVLHTENGGCYGPKKRFYSPDNAYSCRDESAIDKILISQ